MRAPFIVLLTIFVAALALVLFVALLNRHRKSSVSPLGLVGRVASVEMALEPEGSVLVDGELWRARVRSGAHVGAGRSVRVVGARGHLLEVEPLG